MTNTFPGTIVIKPLLEPHNSTFIFIHGKGSNGREMVVDLLSVDLSESFQTEINQLEKSPCLYTGKDIISLRSLFPHTRFVFPTSVMRRDPRFKVDNPQWFLMWSLVNQTEKEEIQLPGLKESLGYIHDIVGREIANVGGDAGKIVIAGLSQGCAMSLLTVLTGNVRLGGFVGFSGWVPLAERIERFLAKEKESVDTSESSSTAVGESDAQTGLGMKVANFIYRNIEMEESAIEAGIQLALQTPIFIGHGEDDGVIYPEFSVQLDKIVRDVGAKDVTFTQYKQLEHWYNEEELVDMVYWLQGKQFGES